MTSIWLFENLVENLLFCLQHDHISEAAALLVFQGASWMDIVTWNFRGQPGMRRNRRAYIAVLLRVAIIFVDIFIVFLSIPREMKVFESDVGRPSLNLKRIGNKLLPETRADVFSRALCVSDKTRFMGFNATAACRFFTNEGVEEITCVLASPPDGPDVCPNCAQINPNVDPDTRVSIKLNKTAENLKLTIYVYSLTSDKESNSQLAHICW